MPNNLKSAKVTGKVPVFFARPMYVFRGRSVCPLLTDLSKGASAPWKICQRTRALIAVSHGAWWLFFVQRRTIAHSNQWCNWSDAPFVACAITYWQTMCVDEWRDLLFCTDKKEKRSSRQKWMGGGSVGRCFKGSRGEGGGIWVWFLGFLPCRKPYIFFRQEFVFCFFCSVCVAQKKMRPRRFSDDYYCSLARVGYYTTAVCTWT